MSIQEGLAKIKSKKELPYIETVSYNDKGEIIERGTLQKIFLPALIILVALLAFGIGRMSNESEGSLPQVKILYDRDLSVSSTSNSIPPTVETPAKTTTPVSSGQVVGSINSTKYHYEYCPGAKQISPANKIYFKN